MNISSNTIKKLAKKYQTPFYLYDTAVITDQITQFKNNFISNLFETEIIYASKAFSIKAMIRLIKDHGLSLDCVSLGELMTAIAVDFPLENVYYHGNNKSSEELTFLIEQGVKTIVVDNLNELTRLSEILKEHSTQVDILIRLNVGIEAHTHEFIMTAHIDSKFGVIYQSSDFKQMLTFIHENPLINLRGFHCHIGSQIFDLDPFEQTLEKVLLFARDFKEPLVFNIGGGFAVKYTPEDQPQASQDIAQYLIKKAEAIIVKNQIKIEKLCIEPGRKLIAESGVTVYTIGDIKKTPNRLYYFIDGGMTDNIRPALYQAKYHCGIVGKDQLPHNQLVTIAGKCCESGDILIKDIQLPPAIPGDLLVVYSTGAYGYAMSSNYNKHLRLPVIFYENKRSKLVVKRQTYQDLLRNER